MKKNKAVSPIVSTVLLIVIVFIMAIIIILWSRGFVKETVEKDIAGNVKRANEYCNEIKLKSIVNPDGSFGFENTGNVPISGFNLKISLADSGKSEILTFPGENVNPGFGIVLDSSFDVRIQSYGSYEKVKIMPIILGKVDGGGIKEFPCPEESGLEI